MMARTSMSASLSSLSISGHIRLPSTGVIVRELRLLVPQLSPLRLSERFSSTEDLKRASKADSIGGRNTDLGARLLAGDGCDAPAAAAEDICGVTVRTGLVWRDEVAVLPGTCATHADATV